MDGVAYTDATTTYETGDTVPAETTCPVRPGPARSSPMMARTTVRRPLTNTSWKVVLKPVGPTRVSGHRLLANLGRRLFKGDGEYWIDPIGAGAYQAYCDMSLDGGGWTLIATNGREATYSSYAISGGYWDTSNIRDKSDFGEPLSISDSHKSSAFWEVDFSDLMFDTDDLYAVYSGVGDDSESYYDFQSVIPLNNAGVGTSYEWEMTAGDLSTSASADLCSTKLYIHPCDYDGGSSCGSDTGGRGPTWSHSNNNACDLDDSYYYAFISPDQSTGYSYDTIVWGASEPIRMWVKE